MAGKKTSGRTTARQGKKKKKPQARKKAAKKKVTRKKTARRKTTSKKKATHKKTASKKAVKKKAVKKKATKKKTAKKKTAKKKTAKKRTAKKKTSQRKATQSRAKKAARRPSPPARKSAPAAVAEPAKPSDESGSWFLDDSFLEVLPPALPSSPVGDRGVDPVRELFEPPLESTPSASIPREARGDAAALFEAARLGRGDEVRRLLQGGADPDLTDDPLQEHRDVVSFMCKNEDVGKFGLDGMKLGRTTCHVAAVRGHTDIVRALIEGGCDVNHPDHAGETPLMLAARAGFAQAVRLLVQAGADVDAHDLRGATALLRAADAGHAEVVRFLVESRADIDARDCDDCTPLIASAAGAHRETVRLLLEAEADLGLRDATGVDALCAAITALEPTEPNTPSPFHAISEDRILPIVALLVESGARDEADELGVKPSRRARERGHEDVARLLLERG